MDKLKQRLTRFPIKKALLHLILIGTIAAALVVLVYLLIWHVVMMPIATALAKRWFIGGMSLYFGGAIIGSFAMLYAVMNVTARLFYRVKLGPPLDQLQYGVTHIQAQDLDFTLQPTSDDELGQLVAAFEETRQALRKALETAWQLADDQKQVNAAFAHDLRTPLTVLQGNLELLTFNEEGQPPDQHLLDEMQRQLDRMNNFIKTMSHVTSIQNIRLNHHAITEAQVEQQLRSEVDKLPTAKTIDWQVDSTRSTDNKLSVSPDAILEVFDNQINNALRFAKAKVGIHLTFNDQQITLQVCNDGQPLTATEQRKVKLPYFSNDKAAHHLGVGMYICNQLCAAHRGYFKIQNREHAAGVCTTAVFGYFDGSAKS